jgi:hypothetical protein
MPDAGINNHLNEINKGGEGKEGDGTRDDDDVPVFNLGSDNAEVRSPPTKKQKDKKKKSKRRRPRRRWRRRRGERCLS